MDVAISLRPEIKLSPEVTEAMFLDAASTQFSTPNTSQHPNTKFSTINLADVVAACGFRKRTHDKKWIPRRLRSEWITLISGLLPSNHRDR